jgi:hypothetical protein
MRRVLHWICGGARRSGTRARAGWAGTNRSRGDDLPVLRFYLLHIGSHEYHVFGNVAILSETVARIHRRDANNSDVILTTGIVVDAVNLNPWPESESPFSRSALMTDEPGLAKHREDLHGPRHGSPNMGVKQRVKPKLGRP